MISTPSSPPASASPRQISLIVPTLNEVENVDELLTRVEAEAGRAGLEVEVVVVDDGSTDGTRERVQAWERKAVGSQPAFRVRLLARTAKDGLAGAVLAGGRAASHGVLVTMDADLSHPPGKLAELAAPVLAGECDLVIGSRYAPGGSTPDWPWSRRLMSRAAAAAAWPLVDVEDALSGFFAVRREWMLAVERGGAAGFKIALEILIHGGRGLRVREVPITFCDRTRGASKMSPRVVLTYFRRLGALAGVAQRLQREEWAREAQQRRAVKNGLAGLSMETGGHCPSGARAPEGATDLSFPTT